MRMRGLGFLLVAGLLTGCAINPATGKRQLVLISESQEIAIGRENDAQLVASLGLYPDDELQAYVTALGKKLAAESERPGLDWHFRVVDDPVINAFALPGGYIYITRGILAHFNNEAELVSVLGHEIGHVTARHSVSQMSKAQLAQGVLGAGSILSPKVAQYGQLAQTALGIVFLKYSRDDERQADDLGLRYLVRANYDPRPMASVFTMLGSVSAASGGERAPAWMSTHPQPENRKERVRAAIDDLDRDFTGLPRNQKQYYDKIDNIVFGEDPRQGYFENRTFLHPEMKFRLEFPDGWATRNDRSAVTALSPEKDAQIQLTLSSAATPAAALTEFFEQPGATRGKAWKNEVNSLPAASNRFTVASESQGLAGLVAAVSYNDKIFLLVGMALEEKSTERDAAIRTALGSFARLTDRDALNKQPKRLDIVRIDKAMSLAEFARRYDSSVDVEKLALINHLKPDSQLRARRSYKVVR